MRLALKIWNSLVNPEAWLQGFGSHGKTAWTPVMLYFLPLAKGHLNLTIQPTGGAGDGSYDTGSFSLFSVRSTPDLNEVNSTSLLY